MAEDEDIPRDAKMVKTILESMGFTRCEPRVINQFLDLWYRYVVDVLGDAQTYSEHAGKPATDCDDVKLAIQSRVHSSFQQPRPCEGNASTKGICEVSGTGRKPGPQKRSGRARHGSLHFPQFRGGDTQHGAMK